jgi:thiamine biosynthesis lipoprotein
METKQFRAMNTDIILAAEGIPLRLAEGFEHVQHFIAKKEAQFTRFTDTSELSELNRSSGEWFQASGELFEVARLARDLYEQTGGLFDPSMLEALRAAGYDRSMDEIRTGGPGPAVNFRVNPERARLAGLMLDERNHRVKLPAGLKIDLGGVAKGWIAERATQLLAAYAEACAVNAGGDLFLVGHPNGEPVWRVELEDPEDAQRVLAVMRVASGAVATSTITRRRWVQGGQVRHHIIDPRSGQPAQTDWLSMTVIAPHAATAEAFAKALLIAGTEDTPRVAANFPQISYLGVRLDGTLWGSSNSKEYLEYADTNPEPIAF